MPYLQNLKGEDMNALEFLTQADPELATCGNKVISELVDLMENYAAMQNKDQALHLKHLEELIDKLAKVVPLVDTQES